MTLPKDMALKVPKDKSWFSEYDWISYQIKIEQNEKLRQDLAENKE